MVTKKEKEFEKNLLNQEKSQLKKLRMMTKNTKVSVKLINDIGKIKISGGERGSKPIITTLANTIGVSPFAPLMVIQRWLLPAASTITRSS